MSFFKDALSFNKSEQRGIILLLFVILILSFYNIYLSSIVDGFPAEDHSEFEQEIAQFLPEQRQLDSIFKVEEPKADYAVSLIEFDPNMITIEQGKRLGIPSKTMSTLISYRNKGGYFETKEDLKKVYGLDDELYEKLAPYIVLKPVKETVKGITEDKPYQFEAPLVDMNSANEESLMRVRGIGPTFAKRIINYREMLGGFTDKSQLLEVYGIDEEKFALLEDQMAINDSNIKLMNINELNADQLIEHPYIKTWSLANAIENYRNTHGGFEHIDDLLNIQIVDSLWLQKISPYLSTHEP